MKKVLVLGILAFLFIAGLITSATGYYETTVNSIDPEETNYYALVIGIEEFAGFETPDQEYLDDSATAFYNRLLECENWGAENIKFLLNEQATKDNISDSIVNWLDERENESDIVLIYYASHGWKIPLKQRRQGHAYVFTHNATDRYFDETKISDKEYDSWLDELDSKHIVIIHENCYSGRMFAVRQFGRTFITAGGKYLFCPANWSDQLGSTMLSYYLLEAFDGVADLNDDGWITASEAFHYARWPVIWHSLWHHFPYLNGRYFLGPQVPYMYDRHIGSIPIIKYK